MCLGQGLATQDVPRVGQSQRTPFCRSHTSVNQPWMEPNHVVRPLGFYPATPAPAGQQTSRLSWHLLTQQS